MAFVYPGSAAIPDYESSLAAFMPAFEKGQTARKDSDAFTAAAKAFGGKSGAPAPAPQPNFLEQLLGLGPQQGPFTRPQPAGTAVAAIDAAAPQTTMDRVHAAETRPNTGMTSDMSNVPISQYIQSARAAESGGNDAAANPNSSALGRYQFLDSTWSGLDQKYPELGLTADGRTDPAQQERAMARFTQDNASALSSAGIPVNPGSLYAAHFLGAGGATKALSADPSTPMSALVDPGVIQANPQLQGMTAGEFAQWAGGKGGNQSGGYQPPMRDEGAGQGQPFTPDEGTMRTLLASEATRPLAMKLIEAQQQSQASQGRFVTEQGQDGGIWQRDTLTGERSVLTGPQKPEQRRIVQGPDGNQYYEDDGSRVLPGVNAVAEPPEAPTVTERFNPVTGQPEKVQWNPATGAWDPLGGAKAPSNGLTVTTNPDGTTTVQQGGPPKSLTEGQGKDTVFLTRANGALPNIDKFGDALTKFGSDMAGNAPLFGNYLKSPEYQQAEQAGNEFLTAVLRKDSGAVIGAEELKTYGDMYLPRPGDSPALLTQKKAARARAVNAIEAGLPPQAILASEQALAKGATPAAGQAVTITDDAGFDALPSGAHFIGPDGQERVKP